MNNLNFRAWHKEEKRMYPVLSLTLNSKKGLEVCIEENIKAACGCCYENDRWLFEKYQEFILMQSTGQKGKGDIEIFDGDIFEYDILNGAFVHEVKGIVKYDSEEGCWKFILKEQITNGKPDSDKLDEFSYMSLDEIYYPKLEIIGNIYEQPELLEAGNE